jgi:hypothetical protein
MSAFAEGDRVRFWGGARPEGISGVVVAVEVAGIPGGLIVNLSGVEVYCHERDLTASGP